MHLTQFPDIEWLRPTAENNFSHQQDVHNRPLPRQGWPNVILNTRVDAVERKGIKGPFSLFYNLNGTSLVKADGNKITIGQDTFGITNPGQYYDLIIPEGEKTTTFNIHFGEQLYLDVSGSCIQSHQTQLDNGEYVRNIEYHTTVRTYFQVPSIRTCILSLYHAYQPPGECSDLVEETLLAELLVHLKKLTQKHVEGLNQISSLRKTTREELLKRLLLSIEYIHDNYSRPITIDVLSAVSCLSKFHYLRTFKEAFGCTPAQYWQWVRWQKAINMLENSTNSIGEIAMAVGFTEVNAFIKFFSKKQGSSPGAFRKTRISNIG